MAEKLNEDFITMPIPLARNGINKDIEPTSLAGVWTPHMLNMKLEPSRIIKRLGYGTLGQNLPLAGTGMKLYQYIDARGDAHLLAATTTHIYEYQASTDIWLQVTPSLDLDECESGWTAGANVTNSDESTLLIRGSGSQKFLTTATLSDGDQIGYKDISSVDASSYTHIGFWIRSSIALAASDLEIVVSESNHASGEKTGTYVEVLATALAADTWTFVSLTKTLTSFDAVISVSIYANAVIADATSIYLDDIRAYTELTGSDTVQNTFADAHDPTEFTANGGTAVIYSNGVNDLLYMEGDSGSRFATLVHGYASFANTKVIAEFWNHFMIINFNDGSQNVRSLAWFDFADIDDSTEGTSGATTLTDSIGSIQDVIKLGADLIFYSEHSITTCRYYGGPIVFTLPTLIYRTGLFVPSTAWGTEQVHYFLGSDQKVYKYAGGTHLLNVGKPIETAMFNDADVSKKLYMNAGYDPGRDRLYFAFPKPSDSYAQNAYVMNRRQPTEPWEYYEFADSIRSFSIFENQNDWYCDDPDWTNVFADEVDFYVDNSYTQSGYPITVFLSDDGYIFRLDELSGKDDAANIECEYQTQDLTVDKEEHFGRWQWFTVPMKSGIASSTVSVYYSSDSGDNWTELDNSPVTLTTAWAVSRLPLDVVSRKIRYKLYQNSSGDLKVRDDMHTTVIPQPARS